MSHTTDVGVDPLVVTALGHLGRTFAESPVVNTVQAVVLVAAVAGAVFVVRRTWGGRPRGRWVLTAAAAVFIVVPYYLLLAYAANRYQLPTYGLLAVVLTAALLRLRRIWMGSSARAGTAVVVLVVLACVAVQLPQAAETADEYNTSRTSRAEFARQLADHGIRRPCVVSGYQAPALAYSLRCKAGDNTSALPNLIGWKVEFARDLPRAREEGAAFVYLVDTDERPDRVSDWPRVKLGEDEGDPVYAYFPPRQERR